MHVSYSVVAVAELSRNKSVRYILHDLMTLGKCRPPEEVEKVRTLLVKQMFALEFRHPIATNESSCSPANGWRLLYRQNDLELGIRGDVLLLQRKHYTK